MSEKAREVVLDIYYVYVLLDPRKPGSYKYENLLEFPYEPFYVGKGKGKRCFEHLKLSKSMKHDTPLYKKIRSICKTHNGYLIAKIIRDVSESVAYEHEIDLISVLRKEREGGVLVNVTSGGEGGDVSESLKFKESMRKRDMSGKNNPMFGIGGMSGKSHADLTKKKMKEKRKLWWNEENRKKASDKFRGKNNPMYGKTPSNACKVTIDGIEYASKREASRKLREMRLNR